MVLVDQEQCREWYEQAVVARAKVEELEPDDEWYDHKYTRALGAVQMSRARVETRWEDGGCHDGFISNLLVLLRDMETDMVGQYAGLLR